MKTAMQELRDELSQVFHDNQIPLKIDITKYLEKEKEQIIEAGNACGLKAMAFREKLDEMSDDEKRDLLMNDSITHGEQYYNQTFNQKK